jgi:hypothetical protein
MLLVLSLFELLGLPRVRGLNSRSVQRRSDEKAEP